MIEVLLIHIKCYLLTGDFAQEISHPSSKLPKE